MTIEYRYVVRGKGKNMTFWMDLWHTNNVDKAMEHINNLKPVFKGHKFKIVDLTKEPL